jgi:Outer membrane protein beta-barrel domain
MTSTPLLCSLFKGVQVPAARSMLFALLFAGCVAPAAAGEWGLDVFGLSYHFDRSKADALGTDNNFNPGLGVRYRFATMEHWAFDAEVGAYRDSGRNTAVQGGVSALWKPWRGLQLGGALVVFKSDTYNDGDTFVAPLPLIGYDFGPAMLNLTYFPKIQRYNDIATVGLWVTLWPERW